MAERRMFTMKIMDSDAFLEMPLSTQALYFHLCMRADDDGFVNNPRKIQRIINATDDDFKILVAKRFILIFESGVIVIKHWRMHNLLRKDRYHETQYTEERQLLEVKQNGAYTEVDNHMATSWQPHGNQLATEDSIGKESIGEDSQGDIYSADIQEIVSYLNEMTGQHYKPGSDYIVRLIKARLNDGFKVEDFKTVIYKKTKEWKGSDYQKYLRPQTLFSTKFEAYLNQTEGKRLGWLDDLEKKANESEGIE